MIIKQKVYFQIHLQNNKNSIFIRKHVYTINTISHVLKTKYEISNRTRGGVITHSLRFVAAHLTE